MTHDEIYEIAWQIFPISDKEKNEAFIALLTHFAKLVAAKEREECALMVEPWLLPEYVEKIRARGQA